ncbi:MAG: hypothetical protein RLZZ628_1619 [Bacteroidota bacterium]|jgi:hypothetical protein
MKYIISIALFLWSTGIGFGQITLNAKNETPLQQRLGLNVGYYGFKLNYPGFQIGIEHYWATTLHFQVISDFEVSGYYQKDQQKAVALTANIGQRYTSFWGGFLENYLGIGIQETIFQSQIYNLTTHPIEVRTVNTNKLSVIPNISLGLGYDFSRKTALPLIYYVRPTIHWLIPDQNLVFQTIFSFKTGIIYRFKP